MSIQDYIHFDKAFTKNKCSCNNTLCPVIVKGFRDINDRRGNVHKFPNPTNGTQKKKEESQVNFWTRRAMLKLGITQKTHFNSKKDDSVRRVTRNGPSSKVDNFIALWHYHPDILKKDNANDFWQGHGNRQIKKMVPKEMLEKKLNIVVSHSDSGYDLGDIQGGKVCILPCYPYNKAKDDLQAAINGKKYHDEIEKAVNLDTPPPARSRRQPFLDSPVRHSGVQSLVQSPNSSRKRKSSAKTYNQREAKAHHDQAKDLKKEVDHLKTIKTDISLSLRRARREIKNANEECKALKLTLDDVYSLHSGPGAGLNRISVSSHEFHDRKENKHFAKMLFGFNTFEEMIQMLQILFDVEFVKPQKLLVSTKKGLSDMEQIMMTLVWTNLVLPHELLGAMFGIRSRQTVSIYINKWMPVLGERGDMLSNLLPYLDTEILKKLEPYSYKDMGLDNIGGILDGKDFPTETCRIDRLVNCAQHSNKLHTSAFRILTWSLACGAVVERTPAFLGRTSEKALMGYWGKHGRLLFPKGSLVLGDKGFDNTAACYVNYNTTLHPAFLTNPQFNENQVGHNIEICQKRYTCEVVYSRITNVKALYGIIPRRRFRNMEPLIGWAHGRANLCYKPLQAIERSDITQQNKRQRRFSCSIIS
jgi:hypothetical protein